ncbi:unnamed protein product [Trichogramma brassicae]|uniref:Uncharacterized protein n=1 Tax=Trichogramma brassicae TaxID=86971 RepID=A0A6H5HTD7_9HYME|nr:unnamed protein product [Trichogramma brassicae]
MPFMPQPKRQRKHSKIRREGARQSAYEARKQTRTSNGLHDSAASLLEITLATRDDKETHRQVLSAGQELYEHVDHNEDVPLNCKSFRWALLQYLCYIEWRAGLNAAPRAEATAAGMEAYFFNGFNLTSRQLRNSIFWTVVT